LARLAAVALVVLPGLGAPRAEGAANSCRLPVFGPGASYDPQLRGAGLTASVSQWVAHDLRQTIYNHIQRLSL